MEGEADFSCDLSVVALIPRSQRVWDGTLPPLQTWSWGGKQALGRAATLSFAFKCGCTTRGLGCPQLKWKTCAVLCDMLCCRSSSLHSSRWRWDARDTEGQPGVRRAFRA